MSDIKGNSQKIIDNKSFFQKYIFGGNKKFFGSTLTIILGIASIGSAISTPQPNSFNEAGWAMILGGLAYRSAKRTKLGLAKASALRQILEILGLIVGFVVIFTQSDIGTRLQNDPFPNVIIPLWILAAYLIIKFKKETIK